MSAGEPGEVAKRLDEAWRSRQAIEPLSETIGLNSPEDAYAIQTSWARLRAKDGEEMLGHKIGLTSKGMREQIGVNEPDYGQLWASRFFPAEGGEVTVPADVFIQPRLEGELAFLLGKPLKGADITREQVLEATDAVAVAAEIIDSRITDWRIKLVDTIADNASFGAFTLGPWDRALGRADLRTLGMLVQINGSVALEATGSAVLGDPLLSVAWLASKLNTLGMAVNAGDIVLAGAFGASIPAQRGDEFVIDTFGQPSLKVRFG
jgi:2-keto-4-pentenoate hydratase